MYCTTPSGTRYQTGLPAATRARQSVEEIAMAGTFSRDTLSDPTGAESTCPGRVTPTNRARRHSSSAPFHVRISAMASAPVMKNSSASGRWA